MTKKQLGNILIIVISFIAVIGYIISKPILQDDAYHQFSDTKTIFSIPNFWNVLSNLPFLIVGILGVYKVRNLKKLKLHSVIFYLGISLVAFGSGYYHLYPNSNTLLWDRLPMTIAFMALFATVIAKFHTYTVGKNGLFPFIIIGLFSVFYWKFGEAEDLRFYAVVQFYPMLIIPILLYFFKKEKQQTAGYWYLLLAYLVAKLFEHFDAEIHQFLGFISGHSLKHIIAAFGLFVLLQFTDFEHKKITLKTRKN